MAPLSLGHTDMDKSEDISRISLRVSKSVFSEIDRCRAIRPGYISRNTWIAEAIKEKLEKEDVTAVKEKAS